MDTKNLATRRWRRGLLAITAALIGVAVTWVMASVIAGRSHERAAEHRADVVAELVGNVELSAANYEELLWGLRSTSTTFGGWDQASFSAVVGGTGVLDRLPGTRAIGWAGAVETERIDEWLSEIWADDSATVDGRGSFSVWPEPEGDAAVVVVHVEPVEGNEAVFGFDLLAEPIRAEAIAVARRDQAPVLSGVIDLANTAGADPGAILFMPEFTGPNDEFSGVVLVAIDVEKMLDGLRDRPGVDFVVADVTNGGATPLFRSAPDAVMSDVVGLADVGGRRWEVALAEGSLPNHVSFGAVLAWSLGLLGSAGVGAFVWVASNRHERIERRALELHEDLVIANREQEVVNARLARLLAVADIGLWEFNIETGTGWLSAEMYQLHGYADGDEELGPFEALWARTHPDDRLDVGRRHLLSADGSEGARLLRRRHRDGSWRWFQSHYEVRRLPEGLMIRGADVDVTDDVAHRDALEKANGDLGRSNESLRDFTHVASHDLRSPLRAIASLVGFICEDADDLPPVVQTNLERIVERVQRANVLIDDLLAYARAGTDGQTREVTALGDLVDNIVDTVDIPDAMSVVCDVGVGQVLLERAVLEMCLRNLVDNAIKHHDQAAGVIEIACAIETSADTTAALVCSVADDGPGIPPEYHERVFDPFRRVNPDEKRPGSGIGLAMVRRALAVVGASVSVESTLGVGSVFTIVWPVDHLGGDVVGRWSAHEGARQLEEAM